MPRGTPVDLTDQRFDKLVVKHTVAHSGNGRRWLCVCDCGNTVEKMGNQLTRGIKSTGCKLCERVSRSSASSLRTHGGCTLGKPRLYTIWRDMRKRCRNPRAINYKYYGAKGIDVCLGWETYDRFAEWALDSGYSDDLSIDRIDNAKGYAPANCRWATAKEQANNRGVKAT